jgi:hypothetical protein
MVAVAIFSIDPGLRRDLEKLPGDDPAVVIVGMADRYKATDLRSAHPSRGGVDWRSRPAQSQASAVRPPTGSRRG